MRSDLFKAELSTPLVLNDLLLSKQLTPQNEERPFSPEKGCSALKATTFARRQNSLVAVSNGF